MADQLQRLRVFNAAMFALHAVQGALMLVLSTDFSLPLTTSFVSFDPAAGSLVPVLETVATVRIAPLVAGFLFLSALAHLVVVSPGGFARYRQWISRGINPARWVEYSLSASLMIVVIAMLAGIYDVVSLLLLFGVNATMIWFGWLMELHNQRTERTEWLPFWFGCMAGALPWLAIATYLVGAGGEGAGPPTFVYWIFVSLFLFFNVFAVNMVLQYRKVGRWREYLYGEKAYVVLSLVAKSLLAWQVFAGTLRPV